MKLFTFLLLKFVFFIFLPTHILFLNKNVTASQKRSLHTTITGLNAMELDALGIENLYIL